MGTFEYVLGSYNTVRIISAGPSEKRRKENEDINMGIMRSELEVF